VEKKVKSPTKGTNSRNPREVEANSERRKGSMKKESFKKKAPIGGGKNDDGEIGRAREKPHRKWSERQNNDPHTYGEEKNRKRRGNDHTLGSELPA